MSTERAVQELLHRARDLPSCAVHELARGDYQVRENSNRLLVLVTHCGVSIWTDGPRVGWEWAR